MKSFLMLLVMVFWAGLLLASAGDPPRAETGTGKFEVRFPGEKVMLKIIPQKLKNSLEVDDRFKNIQIYQAWEAYSENGFWYYLLVQSPHQVYQIRMNRDGRIMKIDLDD